MYVVTIRETLEKAFHIEADNEESAMAIAQYHYDRGDFDFVLSSDDLVKTECICKGDK